MSDEREALRVWLEMLTRTNELKKHVDNALRREHGIGLARFDVLAALARAASEGLRAGALTQELKVSDGNTTQVTAKLIDDGLVKRLKDPADGRVAIFRITPKGMRAFEKMAHTNRICVVNAFSALSPNQLKTLKATLQKIDADALLDEREREFA